MDLRGVAIHAGAACTTKTMQIPPPLKAIGRNADLARGTTLWGIGTNTTNDQILEGIEVFSKVTNQLRSVSPINNLLK